MLKQEWKPGRMRKDNIFIQRPYRELNVFEVELKRFILEKLASDLGMRQKCEEALFNPNPELVKKHKKAEYDFFLYNEGRKLSTPPARRYLAQRPVLGWDIFWAIEDANSAGVDMGSYPAYLDFIREQSGGKTYGFLNVIVEYAICLLDPPSVAHKADNGGRELWEWIIDCCYFYAHSFFVIPWQGNLKEEFFVKYTRPYIASEAMNLKLRPTTEINDSKYMVDFVIEDVFTRKIVAGISVKGYSYHFGKLRGNSSYLKNAESREKRGNDLFRKEVGAPVFVIISGPEEARNREFLEPQVQEMISTLTRRHNDGRYGE